MIQEHVTQKVLVLQGGGALGAYQAGVFEALHEEMFHLDWVVGTSIGAINGAIIAGNEPKNRVARLREFWSMTGQVSPMWSQWDTLMSFWGPLMGPMSGVAKTAPFLVNGIPGFFVPRQGQMAQTIEGRARSYYDTAPLGKTLERLVDFDYLNDKPCRYTACAVDVDSGELAYFDTAKIRVEPCHVMASGALPPGFPAVLIDGRRYWDGGLYSNTPIDVVLADTERRDTVCVMVDLWESCLATPDTIEAAMGRQKDIQYASRVSEHLRQHKEMQNMRRAIHELAAELAVHAKQSKKVQKLLDQGCPSSISLCRLVMKALPGDDQYKDIDFRPATVNARWDAGLRDGEILAKKKHWLTPLPTGVGMAVHEMKSDDGDGLSIKP